jgi:beta-glucanase (GH16 family)
MLNRALIAAVAVVLTLTALLTSPADTAGARTPVAARASAPDCGRTVRKPSGKPWTCTFVDNFGGTTLNSRHWVIGETAKTGFRIGRTCFTKDNVSVGNGHLNLRASDMGHAIYCGGGPLVVGFFTRYTGAHVATWDHFAQAFGRFAVRSRFPNRGPGFKAGLWMYPQENTYGRWPSSGELDVNEWWSVTPRQFIPSLHYRGSRSATDTSYKCWVSTPYKWHVYRLVWTRKDMRFSVDSNTCFVRRVNPDAPLVAPQPFDQPFTMILNMAVGSGSRDNYLSADTQFPATYQVDWAKAWK